jgi:hypothetical protein
MGMTKEKGRIEVAREGQVVNSAHVGRPKLEEAVSEHRVLTPPPLGAAKAGRNNLNK